LTSSLSRLFRRLFLEYLIKAFEAGKVEFFSSLESLRDRSSTVEKNAPNNLEIHNRRFARGCSALNTKAAK
jgi:hypothetical protein